MVETLVSVVPADRTALARDQIAERAAALEVTVVEITEQARGGSAMLEITVLGSAQGISDLEEEMASDTWGTPEYDPQTATISSTVRWARVSTRRLRRIRRADKSSARRFSVFGR